MPVVLDGQEAYRGSDAGFALMVERAKHGDDTVACTNRVAHSRIQSRRSFLLPREWQAVPTIDLAKSDLSAHAVRRCSLLCEAGTE